MKERIEAYRLLVGVFGLFVLLMGVSAAVLFAQKLGTTPSAVATFYRGSEQAFTVPRSFAGLLWVAVQHLLAIPLTIFVVLHLVAWSGAMRRRASATISSFTFGLALVGILAGFAVRFVWPQLAVVKIIAFVGFEALLVWWVGMLVLAPVGARDRARRLDPGQGLVGRAAACCAREDDPSGVL